MTRQMMRRLVRELQDAGYVDSTADPADQRAIIVALTERGWQFCHDGQTVMQQMESEYDQLLGPGELARLRTALTVLATS